MIKNKKEEILKLLTEGKTVKEISEELSIKTASLQRYLWKENIKPNRPINRENLIGQEFGLWKVIEDLGYKHKNGDFTQSALHSTNIYYWLCECLNCGVKKPVSVINLRRGVSRSCYECSIKFREEKKRAKKIRKGL